MDPRRKSSPTGDSLLPLEKKFLISTPEKKLRLVLAVSGGRDSVALLSIAHTLKSRLQWSLTTAHVNHGLRGKESDKDRELVERLCRGYGLSFNHVKMSPLKNPSEEVLRLQRYEYLEKIRVESQSDFIVTAHHNDDLIETRLMRLLQGVGSRGLISMERVNSQKIFRPLLNFTRMEIDEYILQKKLEYRDDQSNFETKWLRNWVRKNWMEPLNREKKTMKVALGRSLELLANVQVSDESPDHLSVDVRASQTVFDFMRQFVRTRLTQSHVNEFQKRLKSPRKRFSFRIAGVDWKVENKMVSPTLSVLDRRPESTQF